MTRLLRFNGVGVLGFGVQLASVALLTGLLDVHYAVATVLGVGAAIVHNFVWHRRWTWADRGGRRPVAATFLRFAAGNGLVSLAGNLVIVGIVIEATGAGSVIANVAAVAVCSLANFWLSDRVF